MFVMAEGFLDLDLEVRAMGYELWAMSQLRRNACVFTLDMSHPVTFGGFSSGLLQGEAFDDVGSDAPG